MNQERTYIKRALISVADKNGIVDFARELRALDIEIISTGGTSKLLREAKILVRDVSEVTDFPEMMDGRVKTLHPKVHGGILGLRDEHAEVARAHQIKWIDLVIVNLYPFAETIKKENVTFDEAIENIDIGGPTMIRSAAKNMGWVTVVVEPSDYPVILSELQHEKSVSFSMRKRLATKAFQHTADYDAVIARYLQPHLNLRYGENPHQKASAYCTSSSGILSAKQHQGKALSYNNIVDADAAYVCLQEFSTPACVIVKHANPCGVAVDESIVAAFQQAFKADSLSAFGGVVALNRVCTKELAEAMAAIFFEVIIAPAFSSDALAIFSKKPNLRLLELNISSRCEKEMKFIEGGILVQDRDVKTISAQDLKIVTQRKPTEQEIKAMLFAWPVVKHIKSNAILIAKKNITLGIGAGQVSRVDSVDIALKKAGNDLTDAVLASDAFFPFRDSIDRLAGTGIRAIIQPGGSIKDSEVIAACDEHDIAMVFTGVRCFKH